MYHEFSSLWKDLLQLGLRDDGWPWDWTTLGTNQNSAQKVKARVIGKSDGVWAADRLVDALTDLGRSIQVQSRIQNSKHFKAGDLLLELEGQANEILALERPFLNVAAYVSGVATATSRLVEAVRQACPTRPPRVTLTRKTLPGYRDVAIEGVRCGGGFPHRVSLSGGVLIKENHIAAAGGISQAIQGARAVAPHSLKIEVEVRSEDELKQALAANADGVLLDNFSPDEVRKALKLLGKASQKPFIEISGGLNENTIASYALEGVDVLSVGSITHSVSAVDLSLLVGE